MAATTTTGSIAALGSWMLSARAVAVRPPMSIWPEAPMLKRPVRKAKGHREAGQRQCRGRGQGVADALGAHEAAP